METPDLARMRSEYARDGLDESAAGDDPVALFSRWLDEAVAAGVHEPNAMALATATPDGRPSSRIVLLKGFDAAGLVFYTGYGSRTPASTASSIHRVNRATGSSPAVVSSSPSRAYSDRIRARSGVSMCPR